MSLHRPQSVAIERAKLPIVSDESLIDIINCSGFHRTGRFGSWENPVGNSFENTRFNGRQSFESRCRLIISRCHHSRNPWWVVFLIAEHSAETKELSEPRTRVPGLSLKVSLPIEGSPVGRVSLSARRFRQD